MIKQRAYEYALIPKLFRDLCVWYTLFCFSVLPALYTHTHTHIRTYTHTYIHIHITAHGPHTSTPHKSGASGAAVHTHGRVARPHHDQEEACLSPAPKPSEWSGANSCTNHQHTHRETAGCNTFDITLGWFLLMCTPLMSPSAGFCSCAHL